MQITSLEKLHCCKTSYPRKISYIKLSFFSCKHCKQFTSCVISKDLSLFQSFTRSPFYKQHFYKQRQAEIGKKIKQTLRNTLRADLLLFKNYFLSSFMLSFNVIGDILRKEVPLFKWGYMINDNENKAENEK